MWSDVSRPHNIKTMIRTREFATELLHLSCGLKIYITPTGELVSLLLFSKPIMSIGKVFMHCTKMGLNTFILWTLPRMLEENEELIIMALITIAFIPISLRMPSQ